MKVEQLDTAEGIVLRSSPTPEEWQRTRVRLVVAAVLCMIVGGAISFAELQAGLQLLLVEVLPAGIGAVWAGRFIRTFVRARPTAVVATDHSLRLERLDGSRQQDLDLSGVGAIRIGPDGFAMPWRWMKGPRDGMVLLRLRSGGQGLAIPPQLAGHPILDRLLARTLVASRARGEVSLFGPRERIDEIERLARDVTAVGSSPTDDTGRHIPPVTIPAGWYADPAGLAPLRWWDGRAWHDYTRETPPGIRKSPRTAPGPRTPR
jgi:hypothetical protein